MKAILSGNTMQLLTLILDIFNTLKKIHIQHLLCIDAPCRLTFLNAQNQN